MPLLGRELLNPLTSLVGPRLAWIVELAELDAILRRAPSI
jgi:hypothetical protein